MKHSLLLTLLMFVCLCAYAQKKEISFQNDSFKIVTLQASVSSLQDSIQSLQAAVMLLRGTIQDLQCTTQSLMDSIQDVEARNQKQDLQKQVDFLGYEVGIYQNQFNHIVNEFTDKLFFWLVLFLILLVFTGVAIPYAAFKKNERDIEKLLLEAKHITEKAQVVAEDEGSRFKWINEEIESKAKEVREQTIKNENNTIAIEQQAKLIMNKLTNINNLEQELKAYTLSSKETAEQVKALIDSVNEIFEKQQSIYPKKLDNLNNSTDHS